MAFLKQKIPPRLFEIISSRIADILVDEIENQIVNEYYVELEGVRVFWERQVPVDKTECPCIIVSTGKGDYNNRDQRNVDGLYDFFIDIYTAAASKKDGNTVTDGYQLSAISTQRLIGVVQAILESPYYKTLGISVPSIGNKGISGFQIAEVEKQDTYSISRARAVLSVRATEGNELVEPTLIQGYDTVVKLGNTNKGYVFSGTGFPVPIPSNYVTILDTLGNVLYNIPPGDTQVIGNSTIILTDQNGNVITTAEIPAQRTLILQIPSNSMLKNYYNVTDHIEDEIFIGIPIERMLIIDGGTEQRSIGNISSYDINTGRINFNNSLGNSSVVPTIVVALPTT